MKNSKVDVISVSSKQTLLDIKGNDFKSVVPTVYSKDGNILIVSRHGKDADKINNFPLVGG